NTWIDWKASFPDTDGAGTADATGLEIPTGTGNVLINFDSPVVGISDDFMILSISSFVHISGGFAFETGGFRNVAVDVRTPTGLQRITGVQVKTTTFGVSDASIFVGYRPGGFTLGADDPATTSI